MAKGRIREMKKLHKFSGVSWNDLNWKYIF